MEMKWKQLLLMVLLAAVTLPASAQKCRYAHEDDYYMAGRVPEEDGKVVFSQQILLPGKNKQQVYRDMLQWMTGRLAKNENEKSRVVYTDSVKGIVVGTAEEWLKFHSLAMSLDRAWMSYQIAAFCYDEKCTMRIEKIRYDYEKNTHYTAEQMVSDAVALNKTKEKMYRSYAKWRNKTVDFADATFADAQNTMNDLLLAETQSKMQNRPAAQPVAEEPLQVVDDVAQLPVSAFDPAQGTLVVCVGTEPFNMTTMTVDKGGVVEQVEEKDIVRLHFADHQNFDVLKQTQSFQVKFYPKGASEPSVVLECAAAQEAASDAHSFAGVVLKSNSCR